MATINKVQRAFDGSARRYDEFSGLHRDIADDFFSRLRRSSEPRALLDVGCGTGYLAARLKEEFPQTRVVGLDFADGMLKEARSRNGEVDWVLGDGHELPFTEGHFDMVTSNLAYQWSTDLVRAFGEARRVLTPGGTLTCTLFGYHTCQELFQSLDEATDGTLKIARLPDEHQVRSALRLNGFINARISAELITLRFRDMQELVSWLKAIGANNIQKQGYLGPGALTRAQEIYARKFPYLEGVACTFEVIKVYAQK